MLVVSVGGIENDGVAYHMWLERPFSQPSVRLEQSRRDGRDPVVSQVRRESGQLELWVRIFGSTESETRTRQEALFSALDTDRVAIPLVVSNDDDTGIRYRNVVVTAIDEQETDRGPGMVFAVTLVTHGDARWRSTTPTSVTWSPTASGQTQVVTNGGSLAARPTYKIQPTDAKLSPGNSFLYRRFCAVKWSSWGVSHYPYDLVDGIWDTESLTPTKISAETNIAVIVDGRMVRRWISNYDTTTTGVWVNLDFAWHPLRTFLSESFSSGATITEIVATEAIDGFPTRGLLQINDELFTYEGKDDVTRTFQNVTRSVRGSVAEDHVGGVGESGDEIHWIQHDIWLIYGGTGYWQNTYDTSGPDGYGWMGNDIYKPMMSLDSSTNSVWYFDAFGAGGDHNRYRSGSWRRGGPTSGTLTINDPYEEIVVTRADSIEGVSGYAYWGLTTAYRLGAMRVIGRGANYEPGLLWRVGIWIQGSEYLTIPEPVPGPVEFDLVDFDLNVTAVSAGYEEVRFETRSAGAMECRLDSVWLYFDEYPSTTMQPEEEMYDLALTLANDTTDQSIDLTLSMLLGDLLEVNTDDHVVRLLSDGSNQYQSLSRNSRRQDILVLQPGDNTLRVVEDGLQGVTITVEFEARSYG